MTLLDVSAYHTVKLKLECTKVEPGQRYYAMLLSNSPPTTSKRVLTLARGRVPTSAHLLLNVDSRALEQIIWNL